MRFYIALFTALDARYSFIQYERTSANSSDMVSSAYTLTLTCVHATMTSNKTHQKVTKTSLLCTRFTQKLSPSNGKVAHGSKDNLSGSARKPILQRHFLICENNSIKTRYEWVFKKQSVILKSNYLFLIWQEGTKHPHQVIATVSKIRLQKELSKNTILKKS